MQQSTKRKFIAMTVFTMLVIANFLLSMSEKVSEWMTRHVYFVYAKVVGSFIGHIECDVFEVGAFIFVLVDLIYIGLIIYDFVKKNNNRAWNNLAGILLGIVVVAFLYTGTAGFAYKREKLDIDKLDYLVDETAAVNLANSYFADIYETINLLEKDSEGHTICPYSDDEIVEKISKEYERLTSEYFLNYTSTPKQIASSYLMSAFGIEGITFAPTVEAGYNTQMLYYDKICAIAHELAHTKGVMREADANEVAYYVLLTSSDPYLKYSAFINSYKYMYSVYFLTNDTEAIKELQISSFFINDLNFRSEFWTEKDVLEKVSNFMNDLYLKINGQSGVDSYHSKTDYSVDVDDSGKEIYKVSAYSDVQNMIFKIYLSK